MPPQGMPPQQLPQAPQGFANGQAFQQQMPPQQQPQFAPQQQFQNDPFAGLTSGSQENRFPFLNAGHHKLRIDRAFIKNTRKGKTFFALEVTVNATNNPRHPPTSQATVFIDLGNEDMRGRHLSRLVCSVHGFDPQSLPKDTPVAPWSDQQTGQQMPWAHYLSQAVSEQNPWQGAEVGTYSKNIVTGRGNPFTVHHWRPAALTEIPPTPADETPETRDNQQQPPQGGPPPQGYAPQQGYPPPQQGYPPPQQGYPLPQQGYPLPQQGYAPQQGAYPQQHQQWPQGGHQAPPQTPQQPSPGGYPQGAPQPQQGAPQPPWGGPPQGGGGYPGGGQ
jgi:hypothetical protein